jgi:LemA protein
MKNREPKVKGLGCLGTVVWGGPILIIVLLLAFYTWSAYNKIISANQEVQEAWADVENAYQKRLELIPNLVNTVKGYAVHEKSTLTEVTEARAKASGINISPENLSEADIAQFEAAQQDLSGALGRLMVVVEQYPDLKANQNFMQLQLELKDIEEQIIVRRDKFNNMVKTYNVMILRFPRNLIAKMFGFKEIEYFKAVEGADKAPEVEFDF